MFGGDEDENPFANSISPFGSSSVYQPAEMPSFPADSPTETSFPTPSSPQPFQRPPSSPRLDTTPSFQPDEYASARNSGEHSAYGPPLEAPILSPKEDRPSPYVAAIERQDATRDLDGDQGGFGSPPATYRPSEGYPSLPSTNFEAAGFSDEPFGVPASLGYSAPPIVDLHAVEDDILDQQPPAPTAEDKRREREELLGLLGHTEEDKMKSAFKKSTVRASPRKQPPPKPKVTHPEPEPVNVQQVKQDDQLQAVETKVAPEEGQKGEGIISPEPIKVTELGPPSSSSADAGPTPPPRPSTPSPPPSSKEDEAPLAPPSPPSKPSDAPATDDPTPLASPTVLPPSPDELTPTSPTQTPLPASTPSSPPRGLSPAPQTPVHQREDSSRIIVSPLETPTGSRTPEFERSFSSLALGGTGDAVASAGWGAEDTVPIVAGAGWGGEAAATGWGEVGGSNGDAGHLVPQEIQEDDDEEDNRPLAQVAGSSPSRANSNSAPSPGEVKANRMFEIQVGDPTKVGLAATAHIVYTVTTRTTAQSHLSRSDVSVLRRFSDFLWLFTVLQNNNPGVIVPPVPDKHPFGRFAEDFVESRRLALEQCLQKMANHPVLQLDPDLRLFLESDTLSAEMKSRKAETASEQKGYLASLTSTLAGPKYYERDDWFDSKKLVLDTLESQLKILVKSIELVSKQRLDLAVATSDFAEAIASLAASDLSKQLSHALERLADIGRRSRDVHEENAKGDVRTFMSTADEYIRLIASVRLAFASRIKTYLSWQSLEAESRRLRNNLEKGRKSGKIPQERVGTEIQIVAEAERRAKEAGSEYESVSRLVKNEFVRFETERVEDFKNALEAFLDGMVKRQKILIAAFEDYHQTLLKLVQQNPSGGRPPPPSPLPQEREREPEREAPSSPEQAFSAPATNGAIGPPPVEGENAWA